MFSKPKNYKDKQYLRFIESLPCVVRRNCSGDIVAHHVATGGMGIKCSDYRTIPLCCTHHTNSNDSVHRLGLDRFEEKHNLDISKEVIKNLEKYIGDII